MNEAVNPYSANTFFEFFYTFFSRLFNGFSGGLFSDELQLFVLLAIALSSALVGTFLVWKKMAMLANALSHTILTGIVVVYLLSSNDEHAMPSDAYLILAGVVTSFLTTYLTQAAVFLFGIAEDASTGIVFTFLFALGIVLVTSFTRNSHIGAELLMGNADLVQLRDLYLSSGIMIMNFLIVIIFFRPLFVTSFDPIFATVIGYSISVFSYLLMTQVAVTAVGAFRAVGVLLFLSFLVAPAIIARFWAQKHIQVLLLACAIGALCSFLGVALSRHLLSFYNIACSTGALVVTILFVTAMISMLCRRKKFSLTKQSV